MQVLAGMTSRADSHFSVLPVFSNVGESDVTAGSGGRRPKMVVFGNSGWRRQAYQEHRRGLEQACDMLGINEVVDIGPPCGSVPGLLVPRVVKGSLPAHDVSRELLCARAGFFTYACEYLGKSGIFAAYAAHGLVPTTYAENVAENKDGLRPYEHFLPISPSNLCDAQRLEGIGPRVHRWYVGHKISEQAAAYASVIWRLARGRRGEGARVFSFQNG